MDTHVIAPRHGGDAVFAPGLAGGRAAASGRIGTGGGALRPVGRTVVFQPRPGLGDLIWHLPLIRAIAAQTESGRVTLVAKPSTQADLLLAGDAAIERVIWLERNPRQGRGRHDGVMGYGRLVAQLRACRAQSCVVLHRNPSLAVVSTLAGIRHRYGYGLGAQRWWLRQRPWLAGEMRLADAVDQANAFARAAGLWPLPEPALRAQAGALLAAGARLGDVAGPVAALGVGSDGAARRWSAACFAALAGALRRRGYGTVLVVASGGEAALAREVCGDLGDAGARAIVGWPLDEVAALLSGADLFVGNDSGLMNLRAALGRPAYGLFGASGPLRHSRHIRPVVPPGGARAGMAAISVGQVLDTLGADGVLAGERR